MDYSALPARSDDPELIRIANDATAWGPSGLLHYLPGGRYEVRQGVAMTAITLPGPSFNVAAAVRFDDPASFDLDQVLASALEFYGDAPEAFGILVEVGGGHPLESALPARGWRAVEEEPAFVMPDFPTRVWPPRPAELRIRIAETPADMDQFLSTVNRIFQMPAEMADLFTPSLDCLNDPNVRYLMGEVDGESVAGAVYAKIGPCATVWGVAVVPEVRRRGYGSAITAAALRIGQDRGCTSAALKSGPMSARLYQEMGFRFACWHRTYAPPCSAP